MTLSVKQITDRYGVHEQTVLAWINSGELRAINVGAEPGKKKPRWRVTEDALQEFEEGRTKAVKPKPIKRTRTKVDPSIDFFADLK